MRVVRTVLMHGATPEHFREAMWRFSYIMGRPWNASDGTSLDFGDTWQGAGPDVPRWPHLQHAWEVRIFSASEKDIARAAIVRACEHPQGLIVDFIDGCCCYSNLERAHIGRAFEEFADAVLPFLAGHVGQRDRPEVAEAADPGRLGGARPLGMHGGTLDRVREAQRLVKRGTPKTEACKRVRIDPRTFDRYVDIEEESED